MPTLTDDLRTAIIRERRRWWLNRLLARGLVEFGLAVLGLFGLAVALVVLRHPLAREAVLNALRADVARLVGR